MTQLKLGDKIVGLVAGRLTLGEVIGLTIRTRADGTFREDFTAVSRDATSDPDDILAFGLWLDEEGATWRKLP